MAVRAEGETKKNAGALRPIYPAKNTRRALNAAFRLGEFIFSSLKMTGKLEEIFLSPFPKNEKGIIIITNHPDGVFEWARIQCGFFERKFLKEPALYMERLPFVVADVKNFKSLSIFHDFLVFVDRGREGGSTRLSAIRRCKEILNTGGNILLFAEGGRTGTRKSQDIVYSPISSKPLGKVSPIVGHIVDGRKVYFAWMDYPRSRFHILRSRDSEGKSKFSWLRFLLWHFFTCVGLNGKIKIIWGETVEFEQGGKSENNARRIEEELFRLADKI